MVRPDLEKYIRDARSRALSDDAIRTTLLNIGWQRKDIDAALAEIPRDPAGFDSANITVISTKKPKK